MRTALVNATVDSAAAGAVFALADSGLSERAGSASIWRSDDLGMFSWYELWQEARSGYASGDIRRLITKEKCFPDSSESPGVTLRVRHKEGRNGQIDRLAKLEVGLQRSKRPVFVWC